MNLYSVFIYYGPYLFFDHYVSAMDEIGAAKESLKTFFSKQRKGVIKKIKVYPQAASDSFFEGEPLFEGEYLDDMDVKKLFQLT